VGVITLAGGQGTRLGSQLPKGCYDIGLPSHKSLFQIQAERLRRLQVLADSTLFWYVMTSEPTHDQTISFFASHTYFGLLPLQIIFFQQESVPCFDQNGTPIRESKDKVITEGVGLYYYYYYYFNVSLPRLLMEMGVFFQQWRKQVHFNI
jgi:UDP-N-acetylglucosamine/UDP-N-acetylgalactosamine diphosphorylase